MATHNDAHQAHAADAAHGHANHSLLGDRRPAFIGLIGGAIFIFAVLFSVVKLTNAKFAGHAEGAKAEATK